eukprot:175406-Prymnesium_polylepis.1
MEIALSVDCMLRRLAPPLAPLAAVSVQSVSSRSPSSTRRMPMRWRLERCVRGAPALSVRRGCVPSSAYTVAPGSPVIHTCHHRESVGQPG